MIIDVVYTHKKSVNNFGEIIPVHVVTFEFVGAEKRRHAVVQRHGWSPEKRPEPVPHPPEPAFLR